MGTMITSQAGLHDSFPYWGAAVRHDRSWFFQYEAINTELERFGMRHLMLPFVLWSVGIVVSICVTCVEAKI